MVRKSGQRLLRAPRVPSGALRARSVRRIANSVCPPSFGIMEETDERCEEFNGAALSESVLSRDWDSAKEVALLARLDKAAAELDVGEGVPLERVREKIRGWAGK